MDAVLNLRKKVIADKIQYLTSTRNYLFTTCYNMWLTKYNKEKVQNAKTHRVANEFYSTDAYTSDLELMSGISTNALAMLGENASKS